MVYEREAESMQRSIWSERSNICVECNSEKGGHWLSYPKGLVYHGD